MYKFGYLVYNGINIVVNKVLNIYMVLFVFYIMLFYLMCILEILIYKMIVLFSMYKLY